MTSLRETVPVTQKMWFPSRNCSMVHFVSAQEGAPITWRRGRAMNRPK
jgi:hypothetical protein